MRKTSPDAKALNDVAKSLCGIGSQFASCSEEPRPSEYPQHAIESSRVYADGLVGSWLSDISVSLGKYPLALPVTSEATSSDDSSSVDVMAETTSGKELRDIHVIEGTVLTWPFQRQTLLMRMRRPLCWDHTMETQLFGENAMANVEDITVVKL